MAKEELKDELSVFMCDEETERDVTHQHLFLGYKPLIIAFISDLKDEISLSNAVTLELRTRKGWKLALLKLQKESEMRLEEKIVTFYRGIHGEHALLSKPHQRINRGIETLTRKGQGNIRLEGNLYEQVRIAYAIPRTISLVSVFSNGLMNVFPTDLHGAVGDRFYIDSLRIGGKANQQVVEIKKIVIAEIDVNSFREAYLLGKNHMKDLSLPENFSLHSRKSKQFGIPLPLCVTHYRELEWVESRDIGIHRIHLFRIVTEETVNDQSDTLAHIHVYYAQWRKNNKLSTNYFFR